MAPSPPAWLERLRVFTLYLLALSLFLVPAGLAAGLVLVWIWFAAALVLRQPLPPHPVGWLALAFALYCLLQAGVPRTAEVAAATRWDQAYDWARLMVFVPLAYAIGGSERRLLRLLLLALIGLVLGTLLRTDWPLLLADLRGFIDARPGFGFPALGYALYAGTAVLGLLLLRRRIWYDSAGALRPWAVALWLGALALLAEAVVVTRARGSWLGLLLVGALAAWVWWREQRRLARPVPRAPLIAGAAAFALLIGLNAGEIGGRLQEEWQDLAQVLSGEPMPEHHSSVALRWHALHFGVAHWLERPWFGWGPGASHALMAASNEARLVHPHDGLLQHLHNSYLELAVQLGGLGLLLWLAMALLLLRGVAQAQRRGTLSTDLARLLLFALLYLAIWSLFNFRMVHQDFRGYWALLAGAALSVALNGRSSRRHGRIPP